MNLWRVSIDEASGRTLREPEPVTNGVQASTSWPRFSKDGSRLVFRSAVKAINPVAIPFDPATGHAGVPRVLDGSNNIRIPSDVSPDGREIAYFSIGAQQEDVFIGPADGSKIRRLTDDAARDRAPMFTRDGKSVVFYSTRDNNWDVWMMRTDGGSLRKIASVPVGGIYPLASPIDDSVFFSSATSTVGPYIVRPTGDRLLDARAAGEPEAGGVHRDVDFARRHQAGRRASLTHRQCGGRCHLRPPRTQPHHVDH